MTNTVITCAVTGGAMPPSAYPAELNFPITPKQIATSAIEAARAGAAVVHLHVRDPETGRSSRDPQLFREVVDRIRSSGVDVLINLTCGIGALWYTDGEELEPAPGSDLIPAAERVRHLEDCLPDIASLDVTSANQVDEGRDYIYFNPAQTLRRMAVRFKELGIKPELETFQAGDVLFANQLVADGLIEQPPLFQFVLGVKWGAPATPETVLYMRSLLPPGAIWTAFGISRQQMPMAVQAVLLGGNIRVGLEDNLYLRRGVFASNAQLVERAATIVASVGGQIATASEARSILKLPARNTAPAAAA